MPVLGDTSEIPPPVPLINLLDYLLSAMDSQYDADFYAVYNVQYGSISNIYIKDKTREKYQGADKCLLLCLFDK